MRRAAGLVLAVLMLAGCAATPLTPYRRDNVSRQVADDAIAFNEAYGQAVTGQILLNVLRARDRLPRHYLSMTGISDSPSLRYRQNLGAGGIPLGEGASPWAIGNFGFERETQSRPAYAVQPFSAETLTRTAFEPTAPYVFAHYWDSGWSRDLLMLLMVERIEKIDRFGERQVFVNEANVIRDDCRPGVQTSGCAFVREMRDILSGLDVEPQRASDPNGQAVCGLIAAYAPTSPARFVDPPPGQHCDPVFLVGATRFTLRLRSLDDIVYYVGELLRLGSMQAGEGGAIEAQVTVGAAGLRGGGAGVPLFRVLPARMAPDAIYAAAVDYGGARFFAGPAILRSCADAAPEGPCRDDAEHGDRTSSVLSLIAELMALNQSPEAIRAPSRLIAE